MDVCEFQEQAAGFEPFLTIVWMFFILFLEWVQLCSAVPFIWTWSHAGLLETVFINIYFWYVELQELIRNPRYIFFAWKFFLFSKSKLWHETRSFERRFTFHSVGEISLFLSVVHTRIICFMGDTAGWSRVWADGLFSPHVYFNNVVLKEKKSTNSKTIQYLCSRGTFILEELQCLLDASVVKVGLWASVTWQRWSERQWWNQRSGDMSSFDFTLTVNNAKGSVLHCCKASSNITFSVETPEYRRSLCVEQKKKKMWFLRSIFVETFVFAHSTTVELFGIIFVSYPHIELSRPSLNDKQIPSFKTRFLKNWPRWFKKKKSNIRYWFPSRLLIINNSCF